MVASPIEAALQFPGCTMSRCRFVSRQICRDRSGSKLSRAIALLRTGGLILIRFARLAAIIQSLACLVPAAEPPALLDVSFDPRRSKHGLFNSTATIQAVASQADGK